MNDDAQGLRLQPLHEASHPAKLSPFVIRHSGFVIQR
jgi:hypothetical protein